MRILLVEDDTVFAKTLIRGLKRNGMNVDWARDGAEGLYAMKRAEHAITLLDIGLPTISGLEILKAVRKEEQISPVLVVTARDGVEYIVAALNLGADDYLVKPFELRVLLARMRAVMRRVKHRPRLLLVAKEVTLDPETFTATFRGFEFNLSTREFAVLYALMERPGTVLSRSSIESRIYGWKDDVRSNAVEVVIHSLRKKCGNDIIKNVRGAGWMVVKGDE
jgi:DNA-binding response OmpR family regulator